MDVCFIGVIGRCGPGGVDKALYAVTATPPHPPSFSHSRTTSLLMTVRT